MKIDWLYIRGRPEFLMVVLLLTSFISIYIAVQGETNSLSRCVQSCSSEKTEKARHACLWGCPIVSTQLTFCED